jgi:hypothetical protein
VKKRNGPKLLFLDIETAPILGYVWKLWDNDLGVNQIKQDWHLLSWAAKWQGSSKIHYMDQRNAPDIADDSRILKGIWKLMDEAEVIVTQNGKRFDEKKLRSRFIIQGLQPPSPYKHFDTKQVASTKFGFTSNSLEYLSDKLCRKKKLKHKRFPGFELWTECLKKNPAAWREMERYNKQDVLALEDLYDKLAPWAGLSQAPYAGHHRCSCGSSHLKRKGYAFGATGTKYQRFVCRSCGAWFRGTKNLISAEARQRLKKPVA